MKPKHLVLIAIGITAFAVGAIDQLTDAEGGMWQAGFWLPMLAAFLAFFWYRLDSDERQFRRSLWLNVGIVALGILAFPYYFVRSRGWRRGAVATVLFLLAVLAWGGLAVLGQYTAWYMQAA